MVNTVKKEANSINPKERLRVIRPRLRQAMNRYEISDGVVTLSRDETNEGFWLKWQPKSATHADYFFYDSLGQMVGRDTDSPLSNTPVTESRGDELIQEISIRDEI